MTANEALALWAAAKHFAKECGGSPVHYFREMVTCPRDSHCGVCFPPAQDRLPFEGRAA